MIVKVAETFHREALAGKLHDLWYLIRALDVANLYGIPYDDPEKLDVFFSLIQRSTQDLYGA